MKNAGPILVEQLGEFLDCDEEQMQVLLDGPMNPCYREIIDSINLVTHDERILIFSSKGIYITDTDEEFKRYKALYIED